MSETSRPEELAGGQRRPAKQAGHQDAGPASPALVVWVVTRRIEHETIVLGVTGDEASTAGMIEEDLDTLERPLSVVIYHVDSHAVT